MTYVFCVHVIDSLSILLRVCFFAVQTLEDERFQGMSEKISFVLHDDTHYEKGALNMRTQRCFAIRSGMNGMINFLLYSLL